MQIHYTNQSAKTFLPKKEAKKKNPSTVENPSFVLNHLVVPHIEFGLWIG